MEINLGKNIDAVEATLERNIMELPALDNAQAKVATIDTKATNSNWDLPSKQSHPFLGLKHYGKIPKYCVEHSSNGIQPGTTLSNHALIILKFVLDTGKRNFKFQIQILEWLFEGVVMKDEIRQIWIQCMSMEENTMIE